MGRELLEASFELNTDQSCREVTASGWNPGDATPYSSQASSPRVGRSTSGPAPGAIADGKTLVSQGVEDGDQLEAVAQAELDRRTAADLVLRAVADGDPRLTPGARVEISGVAPRACGTYVLCTVVHRVSPESGFVSELSTEPPAPPPRPNGASVALGRVTRVDGKTGRVRAALLAHRDVETDWMLVAAPGGGAGKGLTMVPDVGDSVLVLFAQEDPARGVVLGGLYGRDGPPDAGVEGGAVRRFNLHTAGGQRLWFDDEKRALHFEDAAGSFVELTPDAVTVHSKAQLVLEAPGKRVLIRGDSVDFVRG
jgi:phage baseplate assembly protein gpV